MKGHHDAMSQRHRGRVSLLLAAFSCVLGCAVPDEPASAGSGPGPAHGGGASSGAGAAAGSLAPGGGGTMALIDVPAGGTGEPDRTCTPKAIGIVRDFRADDGGQFGHPDFQRLGLFTAMDYEPMVGYPEPGIVLPALGDDKKPVFSGGAFETVHSQQSFDQWYRDVEGVNLAVEYELPLVKDAVSGNLVYDTDAFFPIDARGFGDYGPGADGVVHNFHFTFELHMTFAYSGGEVFAFRGDDDVFVFINGRLAIDLGGVHAPMAGEVDLDARADELAIVIGQEYPIDVFQAERFTGESNFRLETSLSFTNCLPIFAEPR